VSEDATVLSTTTSLCPTCLERVPGRYEAREGSVHLRRDCPDHGEADREVWASLDHWQWAADFGPDPLAEDDGDAADGAGAAEESTTADEPSVDADDAFDHDDLFEGPLEVDSDHACLSVVEVTQDCNLECSYCYASSGPGGRQTPFGEVVDLLEVVMEEAGPRPIQLSGGEPTVRDDLPAVVERATEMGFEHIQVNTNGIRIATEDGYAEALADAGVTAVYLQFDGVTGETYEAIREVDILAEKHAAVEACRAVDLPVVLVPTVVPGTNDDEMGDVVRFALENVDVVQSVNFQPVAHFGRHAEHHGRFSLDEAARRLADQLDAVDARDLLPVPCCSSYCQSTTVLLSGDDGPVPLTRFVEAGAWDDVADVVDESDWMDLLAGTEAGEESACNAAGCCGVEVPADAGGLLASALPVSFTGFMDADAADAERLDNCCISVPTEEDGLVPFCAYNMTTEAGEYALRTRNGWGGRPGVDEPVPAGEDPAASDDD